MNKARPLLLERPGFFSAVRLGGGETRTVLRGAMRRKTAGDPQGNAERTGAPQGVQRTLKSTQDTPRADKGHRRAHGAPQSAWGTAERMGHRRAHGASQAAQGTTERTGTPQSAQGHPRAHRAPQSAQDTPERAGHRRARRDTSGRTGHHRAHEGTPGRRAVRASSLSAAEKRARRPPPEGGKRTFFCFAKKILNFLAKTVDKPLGRW